MTGFIRLFCVFKVLILKSIYYNNNNSSNTSRKQESNSILGQKAFCEDFVASQTDIKIAHKPIVDDGITGVDFDRPGFKQLEELITRGKINCIICKDLSRFSRNYIDAGRYLERSFPDKNIRFIAISDNYDSFKSDSESTAFMLPFKNLINDSYLKDISVKVRSSLETKKKNGEFVGSFCPYGYKRDEQNRGKLVVDEDVREVVQLIFTMFKSGHNIKKIADVLNQNGVLSPLEYSGLNYFLLNQAI